MPGHSTETEKEMLRKRRKEGDDEDENRWSPHSSNASRSKQFLPVSGIKGCRMSKHTVSSALAIVILLISWCLLFYIAYCLNKSLPVMVKNSDFNSTDKRFVGERAKAFLIKLSNLGVKVTGSYENEVEAVELIKNEIESIIIKARYKNINYIMYDHQIVSGSYYLHQQVGFTSVYKDLQNIVVKIGPLGENELIDDDIPSLLVNCHFDSAPSSPGASDDGLNCAVMLEVLRVLSLQDYPLKVNVIFLFNGAEETPLQASHGFITQHKWAKSVKAFINLESCGAGGKEVLFQTGPQHPWLVESYKEATIHPHGSVIAEDIFQGGLIPSDTDFRIFRDFGHVPGLDFAHYGNGYVYHTRFDDSSRITDGVYQHTGDNLLSLVTHIANSHLLCKAEEHKNGRRVYFDVLGLFFVTYSDSIGIIINVLTVILSVYCVVKNVITFTTGMSTKDVIKQSVMCILVPLLGLILSLLFTVIIAVLLDITKSVLSWFSKPYLLFPIYLAPTVIAFCLPPLFLNKMQYSNLCNGVRVQLYCNGVQLLWTIALFIGIVTGLRSAYILMIIVIFTALTNFVMTLLNLQHDVPKWIGCFCASTVISTLYVTSIYILTTKLFIPIVGRTGPNINPELIIGVLVTLLYATIFAYLTPLILVCDKHWIIICGLVFINFITLFAVIFTSFGFPFSEHMPERLVVLHTGRKFHNETGSIIKEDSGMWFMHLDRLAPSTYDSIAGFRNNLVDVDADCSKYIFCGLPLYYTRIVNTERNPGSWVKSPPPLIATDKTSASEMKPTSLKLNSVVDISPYIKRFNFTAVGAHQIMLFLSPKEGASLVGWSIDGGIPTDALKWGLRKIYIIHFTAGKYPGEPVLNFYVDLKVDDVTSEKIVSFMDIALSGNYIEDMSNHSIDLIKGQMGSSFYWGHVTAWKVSYVYYVF